MHNGSCVPSRESSKEPSRSAGSSTRSWSWVLLGFAGESGFVTKDEEELGHLLWPRVEKVGVIGDEAVEPADESRECGGDGIAKVFSSSCLEVSIRGSERERRRLILDHASPGAAIGDHETLSVVLLLLLMQLRPVRGEVVADESFSFSVPRSASMPRGCCALADSDPGTACPYLSGINDRRERRRRDRVWWVWWVWCVVLW